MYEKNQIEELQYLLNQDEWANSSKVSIEFIRTIFNKSGEDATEKLKILVQEYPRAREIPAIIERIAFYQFASGLYNTARETFLFLAKKYPNEEYGERALYYVSRCWQAIGTADSARSNMNRFQRIYPRSRYNDIYQLTLNQERSAVAKRSADKKRSSKPIYSIQTGAFSTNANATIQKQFMENKGHRAEIYIKYVNNRKFYVVCVGKFDTEEEAAKRGNVIDRRYRTKYQVVDLSLLESVK